MPIWAVRARICSSCWKLLVRNATESPVSGSPQVTWPPAPPWPNARGDAPLPNPRVGRVAVVAREHHGQPAVDGDAAERVGVAPLVGLHGGGELDRLRANRRLRTVVVVAGGRDERLIEHRDVGRVGEPAAAGAAGTALRGQVEVQDRPREDLATVGRERLLGVDDRRRAVVLLVGQADVEVVELQRGRAGARAAIRGSPGRCAG